MEPHIVPHIHKHHSITAQPFSAVTRYPRLTVVLGPNLETFHKFLRRIINFAVFFHPELEALLQEGVTATQSLSGRTGGEEEQERDLHGFYCKE